MLPLMLLTSTFNSLNLVKLGPIDKMLETAQGIRNLSVRTGGPSTEWGKTVERDISPHLTFHDTCVTLFVVYDSCSVLSFDLSMCSRLYLGFEGSVQYAVSEFCYLCFCALLCVGKKVFGH